MLNYKVEPQTNWNKLSYSHLYRSNLFTLRFFFFHHLLVYQNQLNLSISYFGRFPWNLIFNCFLFTTRACSLVYNFVFWNCFKGCLLGLCNLFANSFFKNQTYYFNTFLLGITKKIWELWGVSLVGNRWAALALVSCITFPFKKLSSDVSWLCNAGKRKVSVSNHFKASATEIKLIQCFH